jgi:glycosyltransferase involved in cell wall biosynthesis
MKISILTPDYSQNCLGRAWLLAKLLNGQYDVEIVGPAFARGIWAPLKNLCDFDTKIVKGYPSGKFQLKKMLNMISGDVIFASKPLMASFGVGLIKRITSLKPLVLDIDDWELGFGKRFYDSLPWYKKINDFRLSMTNLRSYYYSLFLDKLTWIPDAITVSGETLQSLYGGTIIWHTRDATKFTPNNYDKTKLKEQYLAGRNGHDGYLVGFIGSPRPHKGIEDLIEAMALLKSDNIMLLIVGLNEDSYSGELQKKILNADLKGRVISLPEQPFEKLPELLSMVDVVAIPQRKDPASYGQVPAKIFDAMAMAKPIIATEVSDIPEILKGCGWIVQPEDPKHLSEAIRHVFDHPSDSRATGEKAREKFSRQYSWDIMEQNLTKIFQKYKK